MSRELNPDLFPEVKRVESPPDSEKGQGWARGEPSVALAKEEDLRILSGQVELIKRRLKEHESRMETANTRLNDFINAVKGKFDRVSGFAQRLEEFAKSGMNDLNLKQAQVLSKLNERKVSDAKIQELVDRHNQLVQSFELRLTQMQKVIAEQEIQLMSSRAELKEAQRELARIKRL